MLMPMEIFTTPLGPEEIGPLWYARSRLAQANCGCFVWGEGQPTLGKYISILSRVLEKTAEYTISILWFVLGHINLETTSKLVWWFDCGPHYRAYKVLGTLLTYISEAVMAKGVKVVEVNFGCGSHMKTWLDGYFGKKEAELHDAAKERYIMDTADCVEVWQTAYTERCAMMSDIPAETFINYFPIPKKDVKVANSKPSVLPCLIKSSYSWSVTKIDCRRATILGRGENAWTATNLRGKTSILTDNFNDVHTFTPVIREPGEDEEDDDEQPAVLHEDLKTEHKTVNGWKLSYRLEKPEETTMSKILPRLQLHGKNITPAMEDVDESLRHRPLELRRNAHERNLATQKERAKRYLKGLKGM